MFCSRFDKNTRVIWIQEAAISCCMAYKNFITEAAEDYRLRSMVHKLVSPHWTALIAILEPVALSKRVLYVGSPAIVLSDACE